MGEAGPILWHVWVIFVANFPFLWVALSPINVRLCLSGPGVGCIACMLIPMFGGIVVPL